MRIIVRVKLTVMISQLLQKLLSHNTLIPLLQYSTLCLTMQSTKIKFYFISLPLHNSKMGDAPCDCKIANAKLQKIYITKKKISKIHDEKLQV